MMEMTRLCALLCIAPVILSSSLAMAQKGDGGASTGNVPATESSGDAAGASGASAGTFTLSTGATIAIAIVVTIACVVAISTAVLFYMAKKRQWTVGETLRRSTRRVASGIKTVVSPLTPHKATFSPNLHNTKFADKQTRRMKRPSPLMRGEKHTDIGGEVDMEPLSIHKGKNFDLEKGEGSRVVVSERSHGFKFQKPIISIPKASKKVADAPQTPMYAKMFGRE